MTQNEKKVACKLVAALLDDNLDNLLSEGGRTAFARWMVKNIRPEAPSEEEEDGDVEEDRLYERRYQEKLSRKASRLIRHTGNPGEVPEHYADSEKPAAKARSTSSATEGRNQEAVDDGEEVVAADEHISSDNNDDGSQNPSYFDTIFGTHNQIEGSIHIIFHDHVKKCHNLDDNDATATKFRHEGSDDSGTSEVGEADEDIADSGTDATSQPEVTSHRSEASAVILNRDETARSASNRGVAVAEKKVSLEDMGGFTMWEVCIALSKSDLDEERMGRLKKGFFGLLNQTL